LLARAADNGTTSSLGSSVPRLSHNLRDAVLSIWRGKPRSHLNQTNEIGGVLQRHVAVAQTRRDDPCCLRSESPGSAGLGPSGTTDRVPKRKAVLQLRIWSLVSAPPSGAVSGNRNDSTDQDGECANFRTIRINFCVRQVLWQSRYRLIGHPHLEIGPLLPLPPVRRS